MDGVVGTWAPPSAPAVRSGAACPFAKCADVDFDASLGLALVSGREVAAARVLLVLQKPTEEETVATPDAENLGLRVQRMARCGLEVDKEETFLAKTAGVAADVQWLLTAGHGDAFLVTAAPKREVGVEGMCFHVLARMPVVAEHMASMTKLMTDTIDLNRVTSITHPLDSTPSKRLREVVSTELETASATQPLSARRRLG
eukprot:13792757-Alexandrium_andersonii.AAC.1